MKGKYAKRATLTRDWNTLEQRAVSAERECERLAGRLEELQQRTSSEIATLKERLKRATIERDSGEGPETKKLEEQIRMLRGQLEDQRRGEAIRNEVTQGIHEGILAYLVNVDGLTQGEAMEVLLNFVPGKKRVTHITEPGIHASGDIALKLEAARGWRHQGDTVQALLDIRDGPATGHGAPA